FISKKEVKFMSKDELVPMGTRVPPGIKKAYIEAARNSGLTPAEFHRNVLINNLSLERVKLLTDELSHQISSMMEYMDNSFKTHLEKIDQRLEVYESSIKQTVIDNASSEHSEVILTCLFLLAATHYRNLDTVLDFNKRQVAGQTLFDSIHSEAKQTVKKKTKTAA
ncbi:hypothetical protein, partial [Acinetobacter baumannii]